MTCERCGQTLVIGDFPFCPHGHAVANVIGDDIPGGFVQEHFGHHPEVFYSKKAMLKRADALGLQPMVRHVDGDHHVASWACMDAYTLAAAAELVSRRALRSRVDPPDEAPCESFSFEVHVK